MSTSLVAITGNTYPVKDQLKALGARWNPDSKAWMVPATQADVARRIVAGRSASTSTPSTPGMEHVQMFDSFSGNGAQLADEIQGEISKAGGMAKLSSKQASNFIGTLIDALDDEM